MEQMTEVSPRTARPGWPETVIGVVATAMVGFGLPIAASGRVDLTSP